MLWCGPCRWTSGRRISWPWIFWRRSFLPRLSSSQLSSPPPFLPWISLLRISSRTLPRRSHPSLPKTAPSNPYAPCSPSCVSHPVGKQVDDGGRRRKVSSTLTVDPRAAEPHDNAWHRDSRGAPPADQGFCLARWTRNVLERRGFTSTKWFQNPLPDRFAWPRVEVFVPATGSETAPTNSPWKAQCPPCRDA